jgi:hypothetical protein
MTDTRDNILSLSVPAGIGNQVARSIWPGALSDRSGSPCVPRRPGDEGDNGTTQRPALRPAETQTSYAADPDNDIPF